MVFDPLQQLLKDIPGRGYKPAPSSRVGVDPAEVIERTKKRAQAAGLEVNGEMGAIMLAVLSDVANLYITGGAGTGKTTFLKHILIPELEHRGLNYHITASTGIAGTHVDGKTLHSFLGIGLGPEWPPGVPILNMELEDIHRIYEATYQRWQNNPKVNAAMRDGLTRKLTNTEVIILEEVSMISGWGLLGYVDFFLKKVRHKEDKPFGGVQMIFVGDFGQIPPVEKYMGHRPDWAFMCEAWKQAKVRPMKFTKIHRQKAGWFTDFLNDTRDGIPVSPTNLAHLRGCLVPNASPSSHPNFTFLCATNKEADYDNRCALEQYPGPTVEVKAVFDVREEQLRNRETIEEVQRRLIEGRSTIREIISLRVGLPVLITVNNPMEGYVNGTKGFVHRLVTERTDRSKVVIVEVRVPDPRWSQRARAAFTPEELARVESYDTVHAISVRYWSRNSSEDPDEMEPIDPKKFAEEIAQGRVPIQRHRYPVVGQFPLIPASAITIHKSQGMSLDDVVVRCDRAFVAGQVYVALSRLRSPDGLVLTSLDLPIFADPTAAAFNQTLQSVSVDMGEVLPPIEKKAEPVAAAAPAVASGALRYPTPAASVVLPVLPTGAIRGKSEDCLVIDFDDFDGDPERAAADAAADLAAELHARSRKATAPIEDDDSIPF